MKPSLLPPPCQSGDRIAIIAPSGPFSERHLHAGCQLLRSWGLEPVYSPAILERWGYLAGSDEARTEALVQAFQDPTIRAVLCARGGYGTARLVAHLERDSFVKYPKRFFGFSDITLLHQYFQQELDWITFHSPMVASHQMLEGTEESQQRLRQALFGMTIEQSCPTIHGVCLQPGRAQGQLVGGNLSLVISSIGTPWELDVDGRILFLEDVSEPPYRLDRMFQQLRHTGLLEQIQGLILGDFGTFRDQYTTYSPEEFWLERIQLPPNIPILHQANIGHIHDNATVPIGGWVQLDAEAGLLHPRNGPQLP